MAPRAVVVHRRTELDELIDRYGVAEIQARHDAVTDALQQVSSAIPIDWRRGKVERSDLGRFLFAEDDVVVVVGQDGLVANVAKYLDGQPVIGLNPEPDRHPGVLVQHPPTRLGRLLADVAASRAVIEERTLVRADADDGERLAALNEVYLGHYGHQSARYLLSAPGAQPERQSSSGVIVATGTGATGWAASIAGERHHRVPLPRPQDPTLAWFVREAWPSPATGTSNIGGLLAEGEELRIVVESDTLVVFGDGLEDDRLTVSWGQQVRLGLDQKRLRLVARDGRPHQPG